MRFLPAIVISALLFAGCASATPSRTSGPAPGAPNHPASPPAEAPPTDPELDAAIRTAVGGMFAVDHLGPERFAEVQQRLVVSPSRTLDAFERLMLGPAAESNVLEHLYPTVVLRMLWTREPDRVRRLAERLLARIEETRQHDLPADSDARLDSLRRSLRPLSLGLDVQPQPGAAPVEATRVCLEELAGAVVLWLERDCTCGEPLSCLAEAHGQSVDVRFVQNPGPAVCDDCYPSGTSCTMPVLARPGPAHLLINGHLALDVETDGTGRMPALGCR